MCASNSAAHVSTIRKRGTIPNQRRASPTPSRTVRSLIDLWVGVQTWLFETLVSPLLFSLNLMEWFEPAFNAVEFVMLGVVQIVVIATVMRFCEREAPAYQGPSWRRK